MAPDYNRQAPGLVLTIGISRAPKIDCSEQARLGHGVISAYWKYRSCSPWQRRMENVMLETYVLVGRTFDSDRARSNILRLGRRGEVQRQRLRQGFVLQDITIRFCQTGELKFRPQSLQLIQPPCIFARWSSVPSLCL